jgi:hypothetical protein
MKKILFSLSFILLFSLGLKAADSQPLMTAVPSLTIAPDARAGGMGDVGAATSPDINSQYWNPAKYAQISGEGGVAMSYTPWLRKLVGDINLAYLAGFWKISDKQVLSASLRYFSLGQVTLRQNDTDPGMTVNPNEFAIDFAYSRLLSENWSAAVALRYIRSDLTGGISTGTTPMYPGNAVAADIAAFYTNPITMENGTGNLAFGVDISNIGSKISYDQGNTSNFLPTNLRIGTSFEYPIDEYNRITVNGDLNKVLVPTQDSTTTQAQYNNISPISGVFKSFNDYPKGLTEQMDELMWSLGFEYAYEKQFFLRGGYFNESQDKGNRKYFTAGAGFKLNVFQLDVSYVISVAQSNPLDETIRFSLSFDLEGLKMLTQ